MADRGEIFFVFDKIICFFRDFFANLRLIDLMAVAEGRRYIGLMGTALNMTK